ncbi:unnamed protein product [Rotaria sp. Silwood2]|nr:unnamed protein product [Rotaria sp. Silwood2]
MKFPYPYPLSLCEYGDLQLHGACVNITCYINSNNNLSFNIHHYQILLLINVHYYQLNHKLLQQPNGNINSLNNEPKIIDNSLDNILIEIVYVHYHYIWETTYLMLSTCSSHRIADAL